MLERPKSLVKRSKNLGKQPHELSLGVQIPQPLRMKFVRPRASLKPASTSLTRSTIRVIHVTSLATTGSVTVVAEAYPRTIVEFEERFDTEELCRAHLTTLR